MVLPAGGNGRLYGITVVKSQCPLGKFSKSLFLHVCHLIYSNTVELPFNGHLPLQDILAHWPSKGNEPIQSCAAESCL